LDEIIKPRRSGKIVSRSFRLREHVDDELQRIAEETGESKTYVLESLLEFAIKEWDKRKKNV
jgi:predicted transcriptional regulator